MPDWQTTASEVVYETPWFIIHRDEVLNHNAKLLTYSYIELRHPTVFIVPVNAEGDVLLQRSYRYPIDKTIWEIPAGRSDGQSLLEAAKRELLEETGLVSNDWTDMGRQYQAVGIGNVPCNIFLALDVQPSKTKPKEDIEDILEHRFFATEEIDAMIKDSEICDAPVLGALYLAKMYGLHKKE